MRTPRAAVARSFFCQSKASHIGISSIDERTAAGARSVQTRSVFIRWSRTSQDVEVGISFFETRNFEKFCTFGPSMISTPPPLIAGFDDD
jgi:hypothetical protein